jgi:ABC-type uncharacterized transport system fused permease/ATPase subunit
MALFNTVRQAYILAAPYFSPMQGNWVRIGSLAGAIMMNLVQAKYDESMRRHIYTAFDFFREKKSVEEFSHIFRSAWLRGLIPMVAINMTSAFLKEFVVHSFENAMMSQTLQRWLHQKNYRGLKAVDCTTSQKTTTILADKIPKFTSTTIGFTIGRIRDLAFTIFSLYRVYHLSKPLVSKSIQFPFNCQGGVFGIILGLLVLFAWVKIRSQEGIEKSHAALGLQRRDVLNRITFLERNALQVASFPAEYESNIVGDIQGKAASTLASVSALAMNRFFNSNFTYLFPQVFELFIIYLAHLFAKADPDHFDYEKSFLPLLRESINLMWRSTHFIRAALDDLLGYYQGIQEINQFSKKLDIYEIQQEALESKFKKGDRFSTKALTGKVTTDQGERTLFNQVDLTMEPGHLYFICGINGTGKTIFLKTIAGFHAFEGTIIVPEHVWYLQPKIEIDSAEETFKSLLRKTFGIKDSQEVDKVKNHLRKFRLFYSQDQWEIPEMESGLHHWSSLSDGQRQILNLAVVLTMMENVKTPWLLLADEILSHVDDIEPTPGELSTRGVALDLLKKLADGTLFNMRHTILIVDHNRSGMQCSVEAMVKTAPQATRFTIYQQ